MINKKTNFIADLSKMISGPLVVKVIGLITLPIIARFFSPDAYGDFSLFMAIFGPIGIIITLGYDVAILKPKKNQELYHLIIVCILSTLFFTLVSSLLILIYSDFIIEFSGIDAKYSKFFLLIPAFIFFGGVSETLKYLNLRNNNYLSLSFSSISSTSSNRLTSIILGALGYVNAISLIVAVFLESIIKPLFLFFSSLKSFSKLFKTNFKFSILKSTVLKYYKYPLFIMPSNFVSRVNSDSLVYLLFFLFSQSIVGNFSMAMKILKIPLNLISYSIGETYFSKKFTNIEDEKKLLTSIIKMTLFVGLLPFSILCIIGSEMFTLIFGNNWAIAGIIAQLLSLSIFIQFVFSTLQYVMINLNRQDLVFKYKLLNFLSIMISMFIGYLSDNYIVAISFYSFFGITINLAFGILVYGKINITSIELFKIFIVFFKSSFPFLMIVLISKLYFELPSLILIILSFIIVITNYFIVIKTNSEIRLELKKIKIFKNI